MTDIVAAAQLIEEVSTYLKPQDIELVRQAIDFSRAAHVGQTRKSGESYVTHPIAVARILTPFRLDVQTIVAALLHDVVEDTDITSAEISTQFGECVATLVEGLSKLDKVSFETREDAQAENFRKMLMSMAQDVRVVLIKLADRLHNMRTLGSMSDDSRERIAQETLQIYAQIAYRMGLHDIYQELQDLSFKNLHPQEYRVLADALAITRGKRRVVLDEVKKKLEDKLKKHHIDANVTGRQKSFFSIYQKMQEKSLAFNEVFDVFAFRVLVNTLPDCYLSLGALHSLYKPMPGKFKDYIAIPKENGYQSLHSTLMVPPEKISKNHPTYNADAVSPSETPIEIQIRTHEMHKICDVGVASHWLYKSGDSTIREFHQNTHKWLQELLDRLNRSGDSSVLMDNLRVDLFPGEVYVFTHTGKIRSLPRDATAVDFAYNLHEKIGNHCVGAKVNHIEVPLNTILFNGDRVEILLDNTAEPSLAWLDFVTTARARSYISHFFKTKYHDDMVKRGTRLLEQTCLAINIVLPDITEAQWQKLLKDTKVKTREDILADIGIGDRHAVLVARRLAQASDANLGDVAQKLPVIAIKGTEGGAIRFATCCNPIPGDPIVGEFQRRKGLLVHTQDCPSLQRGYSVPSALNLEWDHNIKRLFPVNFSIQAHNQPGVLAKVSAAIGDAGFNIENLNMDNEGKYAWLHFTLKVHNTQQLATIKENIRKYPEIIAVIREKESPAK
ncbi:MAG: bifunctional (p)ppGpp synthetase/guanosine-3',5'-bis(diphosphate) 3'-pyrophosphohydrolase [Gallionella sp.]